MPKVKALRFGRKVVSLLVVVQMSPVLWAQAAPSATDLGLMQGSPPPADKIVTAENFLEPPFNRWGAAHVREIVPTRGVPVSGPSSALPQRPVELSDLKVDFGEGRSALVGEWLESAYTDAFIVLHHGNVVYERYYNGQTPQMPHLMWSVTKSFTGTMMLVLMEQGLVDGAARVDHYLPELKDTAFGDATVQQLLDMTVSIDYDETYHDPDADITRFLAATLPGGEGLYANLQGLRKQSPDYQHGEAFHYVTPVPDVLGWIIRRVTGWWSYADVNAVAALGIHGQFIYIHSDADVVIAKHSSDPDAESERVDRESALIMHAISRHLAGE